MVDFQDTPDKTIEVDKAKEACSNSSLFVCFSWNIIVFKIISKVKFFEAAVLIFSIVNSLFKSVLRKKISLAFVTVVSSYTWKS